jgi:hypothetical protein
MASNLLRKKKTPLRSQTFKRAFFNHQKKLTGNKNEKEWQKNRREKISCEESQMCFVIIAMSGCILIQYFSQLQQPSSPAAIYPRGAVAANRTLKRYFTKAFC